MIVADVNLVAHLLIDGELTSTCREIFLHDEDWIAPSHWRAEFVNVLATHVRVGIFSLEQAMEKLASADELMQTYQGALDDRGVIELSVRSRNATYDCCYVWLARKLGVDLVTADKAVLREFPDVAVSIVNFPRS